MAIVVKDRVKESFTSTGTANFTLTGAVSGFQAFSAIGNTNYTYYAATDPATGDWEVGYGQYQTSGPTLTRTTVLSSSAAGAKVSFAAGDKVVFCTYPAEKAIYEEITGNVLVDGGPLTVVGSGVTSYTTFGAALAEMYANVAGYAQMYVQNLNTDPTASTDIVAYNDAGDGTHNFIDMGIGSANYSDPAYEIFTAGSGYLYNDGGELIIGSATNDVVLFAGGVAAADEAVRISSADKEVTIAAGLTVTGTLTGADATFSEAVTSSSASVTTPANNEFVTKAYVDNASSAALHVHEPVYAEAPVPLTATYTQGGTTFNITDITGGNTLTTSTTHGLAISDVIWLYSTAGNGLVINFPYFVYAIPAGNQLQLTTTFEGPLLTGLTNATGLAYATRANAGVGAYIESTANATFTISGVTGLTAGQRILVNNQTNGMWNGVYTITSMGSGASKWRLTRSTDQDTYNPNDTEALGAGDYFLVTTTSESFVMATPGVIAIGYTVITYSQFSQAPVYTGGTNIDISGGVISLTGTVAPINGGTGVNTVTTGDLLYGSASNTWSKLPLGAAYKSLVVNGAGTQVEWNAVALNVTGATSGTLPAVSGGTGINSYNVGEMLYANTTTTLDIVTRNTTTTKKFLSQTGTGTTGQAPVWAQPAASDITGLAASATTDTTDASNITSGTLGTSRLSGSYTGITGVGTLAAGTWNAGTIAAGYGGTGITSYAVGDLLYADTTTTLAKLADVAVGNALISGGVSSAPSWGKIGLATAVSGTLPIANGGTGTTSTTFVNLATNVTGTLPVANGGTGSSSTTLTANYFFASPNGSTGSPSFRAIVAADIPTLNQNTTGNAATATTATTAASLTNGTNIIAKNATYGWNVRSDQTTTSIILQDSAGTGKGWLYADASANQGFLSTGGSWMWQVSNTGNCVATLNVSAYSDERVKKNWRDLPADFIEQLAKVKHGIYDRTDMEATQVGVGAQSLRTVMEHAVMEDENGRLSVTYGNAALVAAIKLAERVLELEAKIEQLMKVKP